MATGAPPTGIQSWIHKLEEGEWTRYVVIVTLVLVSLTITVLYHAREYENFRSQEAMDAAQVARQLSQGKGFSTQFIRPFSILLWEEKNAPATIDLKAGHPDLANAPIYPLLLAGLMKILPLDFTIDEAISAPALWRFPPEVAIGLLNQFFFFGTLFLVFRLARRLFDASVAWVATVTLAGTLLFWRFTFSGLPTNLLCLIFVGVIWSLVTIEQNAREGTKPAGWFFVWAGVTGLLVAMGCLTRYAFGWLILPVLAFLGLFAGVQRLRVTLVAAAVFAVVLAPWLARNYQLSGAFFGTAGFAIHEEMKPFPGNRLERVLRKEMLVAGQSKIDVADYIRKLVVNGSTILQEDLPKLAGSWVSAFFLVGLLIPFRNVALVRLRYFALGTLVLLVAVQALGRTHLSDDTPIINSENLLVILAPLAFIFGAGLFVLLLDQIELPIPQLRRLAIGIFVLVMCLPMLIRFLPPRAIPLAYPPYFPPLIQEIAGWMKSDELIMSDMPWAVAWYGDRKTVLVTLDAPSDRGERKLDFFRLNDYRQPVQALYLTPLTMDARFLSQMLKGQEWAWGRFVLDSLLRTNVPTGFPLKYAPSGFLPDQLLLTDRMRWRIDKQKPFVDPNLEKPGSGKGSK